MKTLFKTFIAASILTAFSMPAFGNEDLASTAGADCGGRIVKDISGGNGSSAATSSGSGATGN